MPQPRSGRPASDILISWSDSCTNHFYTLLTLSWSESPLTFFSFLIILFCFIPGLDARASLLVSHGLAASSRRTYSQGVKRFIEFCNVYSFNPLHISELLIIRFITHISSSPIATSTVRVYLSAIRAWYLSMGRNPGSLYTPRISWVIRALDRSNPAPVRAAPFTIHHFALIFPIVTFSDYSLICISAMLVGYFGCLRASEYLSDPGSPRPLTPAHVRIVEASPPYATLEIPTSKTAHRGFSVVLGCTGRRICAVCWLRLVLRTRSLPPHLPLFSFRDGAPLTRALLARFMQGALRAAGVDPSLGWSPHSLRAGAATDASGLGWSAHQIQAMGRWRSDAYTLYIRPSDTQKAASTALLTSNLGPLIRTCTTAPANH